MGETQAAAGRRLFTLAFAVAIGLIAGPAAWAQTAEDAIRFTERSPATGARMLGMAGASTAGLADYSALFSNPAGLGYFQRSSVSGALNSVFTTDQAFYSTPGFSSSVDEDVSSTNIGNLAYIYRFPTRRGSFVMGAAYNQVQSFERDLRFEGTNSTSTISTSFLPFNDEYDLTGGGDLDALGDIPFAAFQAGVIEFFPEFLDEDPDAYPFLEAVVPGTSIEQRGNVLEEGRTSEVNFGGAVEASRGVMVGLSVNIPFGTYQYSSLFEEDDVLNQNTGADYSVFLDDGELYEGFDYLTYRQFLETDLVGINLRGGVSFAATRNVRVGLSVETPTYYSINEVYGASFETGFDDGNFLRYGSDPADVGNGEFEYEIITPWRLGVGVAFSNDMFSIMADAEFVDWSQLEFDASSDRAFFDDLNREIGDTYEQVINTRIGVEYRAPAGLLLRGGFAYQPDPLDVALQTSDGSDLDRDKTFFSLGAGYRFENQFQIDFGWMQGRFDSGYSAYPEDSLGPRQDDVLLIDEEIVQNQFVVGVSFFF